MKDDLVALDTKTPVWDRFFTVAPLVLIGTTEENGSIDLAPKHMATSIGLENYFGFVCTPEHGTYRNIKRTGVFTVSYPRPSQLLYTSLAASPRCGEDAKVVLDSYPTFPATKVEGVLFEDSYLFLECELLKIIDGFGKYGLITGSIVAAHAHRDSLRASEREDQELIHDAPILAYLHPSRFATIKTSYSFPFPAGMKR